MVKQTNRKEKKHIKIKIKPQTRYKQTANPLSRTGLTRPIGVPARRATFPQVVF